MRFEKAEASLNAAALCHVNGYHDSSVSRSYYAAFQAAIVALEAAGIESAENEGWSHAGLQATFARELIRRRKLYPADFARYLQDLLDRRLHADYDPEVVGAPTASRALAKARVFVEKVKEITVA